MIWVEVGGMKGAVKVKANATCAGIILLEVNKVEIFSWWGFHMLLFIVSSGMELLLGPKGRNNTTWLMWVLVLFVVVFSKWSGGWFDEFA